MRRLLALTGVLLAVPLLAGTAPGQTPDDPVPEDPEPAGDVAYGEGHVLETDFEFSSKAGPNGENIVGTLTTRGYLQWTASQTCGNAKGNHAVGGYRIKTGPHAGEGFISEAVDNGPPIDGRPVDETVYSGYLPEPPVNCPAPGDGAPAGYRPTGGGPFTRGDWTLINVDEQLPEGTPQARIAAMRLTVRPAVPKRARTVRVRVRVCGAPGMALLTFAESTDLAGPGWGESGGMYWRNDLRHDRSCTTHVVTRKLTRSRALRSYEISLRARTTGRRWSKTVSRRLRVAN
jgi:hypothetical protein